jgi:murein DD-endopeptidase MepM/ murein hydrolase activator NlpD
MLNMSKKSELYKSILPKLKNYISPVLGYHFMATDFHPISLSVHNPTLATFDITQYDNLEQYINAFLTVHRAKVAYGGYCEERAFYQADQYTATANPRCMHLGIDLWAEAHTPIYAPFDAKIHSFQYNDKPLDYGATIILEHYFEGCQFFTLYGHLTLASLQHLEVGQAISQGTPFTAIGHRFENGGWVPHLHFQVILDMLGNEGDFIGVATQNDLPYYSEICPDAMDLLSFK